MTPSLFVSHGAPDIVLKQTPTHNFLVELGKNLKKPKAVIIVSAHWETENFEITSSEGHGIIHDYMGFPRELSQISQSYLGSEKLANSIKHEFEKDGYTAKLNFMRGLDHGVWTVLLLLNLPIEVPIVQISLAKNQSPATHYEIGRILAKYRKHGFLIIGSGGYTHNLRLLSPVETPANWASKFADWFDENLYNQQLSELFNWRQKAPSARIAHPTSEHLMPIFVAMGAAGERFNVKKIHEALEFGSLRLDAFEFTEKT